MPIYEYRCTACNKVFEEWHKQADDIRQLPCPTCKGEAQRLISNTTFMLKGGGWYVTDYGNRKNEASDAAGSAGSAGAAPAPSTLAAGSHAESAPAASSQAAPVNAPQAAPAGKSADSPAAKPQTAPASEYKAEKTGKAVNS